MSISGLCQICESRSAEHQCADCGALVCEVHFEEGLGVCTACASDRGERPGDEDDLGEGEEYRF